MSTQTPQEQGKAAADRDQFFKVETVVNMGLEKTLLEMIMRGIDYETHCIKLKDGKEIPPKYDERYAIFHIYSLDLSKSPEIKAYYKRLHELHQKRLEDAEFAQNFFIAE